MDTTAGSYVGPDTPALERFSRLLERSHDDARIRDALGRQKNLARDAVTGHVQPCYHYRLECGRIVAVWTEPLPSTRTVLFCEDEGCRRERRVVEILAATVGTEDLDG